jgi:hypothetical protein
MASLGNHRLPGIHVWLHHTRAVFDYPKSNSHGTTRNAVRGERTTPNSRTVDDDAS